MYAGAAIKVDVDTAPKFGSVFDIQALVLLQLGHYSRKPTPAIRNTVRVSPKVESNAGYYATIDKSYTYCIALGNPLAKCHVPCANRQHMADINVFSLHVCTFHANAQWQRSLEIVAMRIRTRASHD